MMITKFVSDAITGDINKRKTSAIKFKLKENIIFKNNVMNACTFLSAYFVAPKISSEFLIIIFFFK